MRKFIYAVLALMLALILSLSFFHTLFNLFKMNHWLGWSILGFCLFAVAFLLTDSELVQPADK